MQTDSDLDQVLEEARRFQRGFTTLLMATVGHEGQPEASYAPYLEDPSGTLFVLVSELAQHTRNLLYRPRASVLFIEDERDAANPFARRRLSLRCDCRLVQRDEPGWLEAVDGLQRRFGQIIAVLRGLSDFHLLQLQPSAGTYVRGFGQAYELSGSELSEIRHIDRPAGMRKPTE